MSSQAPQGPRRGPIAWMVENRVTPNLIMLFLLLGGLFVSSRIKQEVFPEFELDQVTIQVAYPGASPEEVEQGIVLVVEEAIQAVDGVEEVTATASEGSATIAAELRSGGDRQKIYQDIRQEIDRVTTLPVDAEEPVVSLVGRRREVLRLDLYGDVGEVVLRQVVEQVRDRLLLEPVITQIDIVGGRDHEIVVEVPSERLRAHNLSHAEVGRIIAAAAVELPGGKLETPGGELLLRVRNRADWAQEFAAIPLLATGGTVLTLGDIAVVRDDFEDSDRFASYNGLRAMGLEVYRVGDETPTGISRAVRQAMPEIESDLPAGISWAINDDRSEIYQQRLSLLLKNALFGFCLVLVLLGLFLEIRLAFWVTMGIPISFLGGLLLLPALDVSINMISMFAFIVALGIVVDDAIIAGENIYEYQQQGMDHVSAAIRGARDVATPIAFSILTNVAAFLPLFFVPGVMGKIWRPIPLVVITVFLISWLESLLILPSHLAHSRARENTGLFALLSRKQQAFGRRFTRFIECVYGPFLAICLRWRVLTVAAGLAVLLLTLGFVASGRIGMILMPRVESDKAVVTAVLPFGSPLERGRLMEKRLVEAVSRVAAQNGGDQLVTGVSSLVNENRVEVTAYLTPPGVRPLPTREVTELWRRETGEIAGLQSLRFESDRGGPGRGAALSIELSHRDIDVLDRASAALGEKLAEFPAVSDVDDGYAPGKRQLDFTVTPAGLDLGLAAGEIARQVRSGFQGVVALRQQRGRNEVTVRVRLPEEERSSAHGVENFLVRTPAGTFVPLEQVAAVREGRGYTSINRRNGRRTVTVSANVEPIEETTQILEAVNSTVLPALLADHSGLTAGFEGREADRKESVGGLFGGFRYALFAMFFLLAIPFRSYLQPLVVMAAIPFGVVGAVLGHLVMGYSLSLMSMMGMVALSGVVVNDSLVLVDYTNRLRRRGFSALEAIQAAGVRRFRPILLTTLTTFGGLAPMIFETSRQARFMIPMALSLGFGILFSTLIVLLLVPCLYLFVEDFKRLVGVTGGDSR